MIGNRRSAEFDRLRSAAMFACQEIRSILHFTTQINSVCQEFKQVRNRIQIPRTRRRSNRAQPLEIGQHTVAKRQNCVFPLSLNTVSSFYLLRSGTKLR